MKRIVFSLLLLSVLVLGVSTTNALAQGKKPLKGKFVFTLVTPVGTLPIPFEFKKAGKGVASAPGPLALAYREDGDGFSISVEVPKTASPTGQQFTLIVRGTKTTDNDVTGTLLIITEQADPNRPTADPIKVVVAPGSFTGKRQ